MNSEINIPAMFGARGGRCGSSLFLLLVLLVVGFSATAASNSSNPFISGCLREKLPGWEKLRVCNSEDPPQVRANGLCVDPPPFDYLEIRVASGNWDSNTALAWLTQIILSELLGVPSSNEAGAYGKSRSFYDYDSRIDYDKNAHVGFIETAAGIPSGDCNDRHPSNMTNEEDYEPCAHFIPEFWGANNLGARILVDEGKLEPPQGIGLLGQESWYVTKFTAAEDPTLDSYHGLSGEKNRQKLAKAFKRPTTWQDYCEIVSEDNCTTPDETAKRYPTEEGETTRMFVEDLYTGHFRYSEKNNCILWPTNCTGHVANYPCGWSSKMEASIYHLNMALDPNNGPDGTPNGYTTSQLTEMWHAANATKSNLMMMWWTPEPLFQQYLGTDAELQPVMLKPYTMACADAFISSVIEGCSENLTTRVGPPEAACANPVEPLAKMTVGNLYEVLYSSNGDIKEAAISPAYNMLRRFHISEAQLGEIFALWSSAPTPRDGVCQWAVDNLDHLKSFIPDSYPRVTIEEEHSIFGDAMIALGSLATLITLITAFAVYKRRMRPAVQCAQLDFLYTLLTGSFFVCVGSILTSVPASDESCVAKNWFIHIGYTLELVPLIIKVAAINRMMEAARAMRRVTLSRNYLYGAVAIITGLLSVYLVVWTVLDPSTRTAEYKLLDTTTEQDEQVVGVYHFCSSESLAWEYVAVGWNAVLLLCATVLAFQTRNVVKTHNESKTLGVLIYSHFLFVVLRCCTFLLSGHLTGSTLGNLRTLLYSVDQIAACLIYFLPKLVSLFEPEASMTTRISGLGSGPFNNFTGSGNLLNSSDFQNSVAFQNSDRSPPQKREQSESAPGNSSGASVTFDLPQHPKKNENESNETTGASVSATFDLPPCPENENETNK